MDEQEKLKVALGHKAEINFSEEQNLLSIRVHALQEAIKIIGEVLNTPGSALRALQSGPVLSDVIPMTLATAKAFEQYLRGEEKS